MRDAQEADGGCVREQCEAAERNDAGGLFERSEKGG